MSVQNAIGKVPFSETMAVQAVLEMLEDRMKEVVHHCMDVNTVDEKPCEVNIKVKVTPNVGRNSFSFEVSGATKLSPFDPAGSQLYTNVDDDGKIEYVAFAPENQLPFNQ